MLGSEVMDLQVVPFGNAQIENNKTITCQHGLAECDANTWEQCMIHSFPQPKQYLPMLSCLEDTLPMGFRATAFPIALFETCARQANLDFDPIQQCHDNPSLATKVLQQAADATPADHNHVPWVEIDGIYMNEDTPDFRDEICKAYELRGGSHPACSQENDMAYEESPYEQCPCNKRVKVKVCTEALCPGCREFVLEHLVSTFAILGSEVMDVHVVPFGNAKIDSENKTITCQHGVGECDANTWEQCMIHFFPHPEQYLPMLSCLEDALPMGSSSTAFPVAVFKTCAKQANLDFYPIQHCHDDPALAAKVLQEAANATPADHTYVPWVEIDDNHLDMESQDFMEQVCKAYVAKGGSHPACNKGKPMRIVDHRL
jgi:interferon gamma-inducible protein 30